MTGPEHYRAAEQAIRADCLSPDVEAQVRALLALVGVVAETRDAIRELVEEAGEVVLLRSLLGQQEQGRQLRQRHPGQAFRRRVETALLEPPPADDEDDEDDEDDDEEEDA